MAKFILVDSNNRVFQVQDSRPTDASSSEWIEVSNDSVQEQWYYKDGTLSELKPLSIFEVRQMRNKLLEESDWMVLEDSIYQAADQSSNLTAIKTWRQSLRDFPDESASYDESITFPELTLS